MQQEVSNIIKWKTVRIPEKLYEEANQRKEEFNCTSPSELTRKVLEEFLRSHRKKGETK
jgi:metal-responsive CopG/Arc/MetJ family transcriptional regulator